MQLAHPTALFWLTLAVPITLWYFVRIRPRRAPVPTTFFWRQLAIDRKRRSFWDRLQNVRSLLVQLLLLSLLALALAEPFLRGEQIDGRRLVIVIDNSASMSAADGGRTRLDLAKAAAADVIDGLRDRDEVALVTSGHSARLVCGLTGHRISLVRALLPVATTDTPGRPAEAVALARRLLAGAPNGRILFLTDCCFGKTVPGVSDDVRVIAVGRAATNLAISRFQARRRPSEPAAYEVLVEVVNHSDQPAECRLLLDRNGSPVDVLPLRVVADGRWQHVGAYTSVDGGTLTARLDRTDALDSDNRAFAILPPALSVSVVLVRPGGMIPGDDFLDYVFEANPVVRQPTKVAGRPESPGGETVQVLHGPVPKVIPPGRFLVIDPHGSSDLWQLGGPLPDALVARQEKDSPLTAHLRLEGLTLPGARKLSPLRSRTQALAWSVAGDPLCLAIDRPEGRVLVLTTDLDAGDLPLRTAFPILVSNALTWLSGDAEGFREAVPAGSVVRAELPPGTPSGLRLFAPDGRSFPLPAGADRPALGPLDRVGVWRVAAGPDQPAVLEWACNPGDEGESDLRPQESPPSAGDPNPSFARPLWFYLLSFAAGLVVVEWGLYQRRYIR